MIYLLTTSEDSVFVSKMMKETTSFDVVIFWENCEEAVEIKNITPQDTVVFALKGGHISRIIIEVLRKNGVPEDNIIDFYKIFNLHIPAMTADRVMGSPFFREYNGIILGLSHAEVNLLSDMFTLPTANLAVSSQDMYYNYMTLKYVTEQYPEKLKDVRYLILDMYKYNYFNFDTSKSKMAIPYYSWGGYDKDPHHFEKNSNVHSSFGEVKKYLFSKRKSGVTSKNIDVWGELFDFNIEKISKETFSTSYKSSERGRIVTDEEITGYNYAPANVRTHFEDTIKENVDCFNGIIKYAMDQYPGIRIYVIQMPMPKEAWERAREYYLPWKEEFEDIVLAAVSEYGVKYLDMTCHPISEERVCWQDPEHLNYYGSLKYTEEIDKIVSEQI